LIIFCSDFAIGVGAFGIGDTDFSNSSCGLGSCTIISGVVGFDRTFLGSGGNCLLVIKKPSV